MKLTYWSGYLAMFYFLDKAYFKYKWDDLGVFLGAIDPFIFEGGLPMDQNEVIQWLDIVKKDDILVEKLNEDETFVCMQNFIAHKHKVRSWDLEDLEKYLKNVYLEKPNTPEWTEWIDCCLLSLANNK